MSSEWNCFKQDTLTLHSFQIYTHLKTYLYMKAKFVLKLAVC